MTTLSALREEYDLVTEKVVRVFCEKQKCDYEHEDWVGDIMGGVICLNDCYLSYNDICIDLFTKQKKGLIFDWYWEGIDRVNDHLNYESYSKGLRYDKSL